jgi:hypothetical protein
MANWRNKAWKIASKIGDAAGPRGINRVKKVAPLEAPAPKSTSVTPATVDMEQEKNIIRLLNQKYSSSASDTTNPGLMNTAWTENLQRVAELPSLLSEESLPLEVLEETTRHKLEMLAEGMGCSPWEMIMEIMTFYIENQADIAEWGTVYDAVTSYLENEIVG